MTDEAEDLKNRTGENVPLSAGLGLNLIDFRLWVDVISGCVS